MPTKLFLDFETYCDLNIRDVGAYRLIEHPSFFPLMCAYALDDEPVRLAVGVDNVLHVPGLFDEAVVKVAHNAAFERLVTSWLAWHRGELERGEYLPPEGWHDTMAIAAERGLPQGLDALSRACGAPHKSAGTALINWFCKPDRKGDRRLPSDHPEKWQEFKDYCEQDVVAMRGVHQLIGGWNTKMERAVYLADQRINDRGMRIDVPLARVAAEAGEDNRMYQELEVTALTKCDELPHGVLNPGSREQLLEWLLISGLEIPDLKADTVTAYLERDDLTPAQRRVLELRQELALSAAAKYNTALDMVCGDGRLRGLYRFFGAHTGRWAGRGVQPHNLPREQITRLDFETGKQVHDEQGEQAAILDLLLGDGASSHTLKALVRALFLGPLSVVDYASIEARVIAWLAGEEWALRAFAEGRDIYVETAERMSTETKKFDRRDGKIAVLALGYSGGTNSMTAMGAEGHEAQLQRIVDSYRDANPAIVNLWHALQRAFLEAQRGGKVQEVGQHLRVSHHGGTSKLWLPSGRAIAYHQVKWTTDERGRPSMSFIDPKKSFRTRTYGGRLAENATQAIARDVLAEALVRLEAAGYPVVGHVHDEVLVEGEYDIEEIKRVMVAPPEWARGLPLDGEGFTTQRYRKG